MCLGSQIPASPLPNQCRFLLSTQLRLVAILFFFRRIALLVATHCIAWSDIPIHFRNVAAMEPQVTIGEPDFRIARDFPIFTRPGRVIHYSTSHGTCTRTRLLWRSNRSMNNYTSLISSWSNLWTTVALEVPSSSINQVSFKFHLFAPCDTISVANFFDGCLVNVLPRWLVPHETPDANPTLRNVVKLWRARVATYNNDVLIRIHRYQHVVANRLRLSIGAANMQVFMQEETAASWEQLKISQIFSEAKLHTYLAEPGAIPSGARFRLSSTIAILLISTFR